MRVLFTLFLLTLFAMPCYAGSCGDTQEAATTAIKERNGQSKKATTA